MDFILQFPGMSSIFFFVVWQAFFSFSMLECCIFWYSYKYFWALFWEAVIWNPFDLFEISFWTLLGRTIAVLTGRWLFSSTVEYPCVLWILFYFGEKEHKLKTFPSLSFGFSFPSLFFLCVLSSVLSWGFEIDCQFSSVLFQETFSSLEHWHSTQITLASLVSYPYVLMKIAGLC